MTKLHLLMLAALTSGMAHATVRLPEVLGDHMVLQQQTDVPLWGWAFPGESVLIKTSWGIKAQTEADAQGTWRVKVKTPAAQPLAQGLHPEHITFTVPNENTLQEKLDVPVGLLTPTSSPTGRLRNQLPPRMANSISSSAIWAAAWFPAMENP
ncbi:MAG: hypothetical protein WCP45_07965 [Verrucomicrobiota bacterium]